MLPDPQPVNATIDPSPSAQTASAVSVIDFQLLLRLRGRKMKNSPATLMPPRAPAVDPGNAGTWFAALAAVVVITTETVCVETWLLVLGTSVTEVGLIRQVAPEGAPEHVIATTPPNVAPEVTGTETNPVPPLVTLSVVGDAGPTVNEPATGVTVTVSGFIDTSGMKFESPT